MLVYISNEQEYININYILKIGTSYSYGSRYFYAKLINGDRIYLAEREFNQIKKLLNGVE